MMGAKNMNIVSRVKGLLLDPKSEWPKIEAGPGNAGYLFPNYVMILTAIAPICNFIGFTVIGYKGVRFSIAGGLLRAVVFYVLSLVVVYVMAYVIDFFAGVFGGQKNFANAMRISAYWETAGWLAAIFNAIPYLSFLELVGFYSIYLLHTGIVLLMKPPESKAMYFSAAVFVCSTVLTLANGSVVIWLTVAGIAT
jgi:hypothetical protein